MGDLHLYEIDFEGYLMHDLFAQLKKWYLYLAIGGANPL